MRTCSSARKPTWLHHAALKSSRKCQHPRLQGKQVVVRSLPQRSGALHAGPSQSAAPPQAHAHQTTPIWQGRRPHNEHHNVHQRRIGTAIRKFTLSATNLTWLKTGSYSHKPTVSDFKRSADKKNLSIKRTRKTSFKNEGLKTSEKKRNNACTCETVGVSFRATDGQTRDFHWAIAVSTKRVRSP